MKNTIFKYFIFIIGAFLLFFSLSSLKSYAVTSTVKTLSDSTITIFTSNSCEFCDELKTALQKDYSSFKYSFKNIDASDANKKEYQVALVTCGKKTGTVPMFLFSGSCVSGKDQILESFSIAKSAKEVTTATNAEATKSNIISSTLSDFTNLAFVDEFSITDYAIGGALFIVLIVGLVLVIRQRGSVNKRAKLISTFVFVLPMLGIAAFMLLKVNSFNDLSATGADAGKKSKNCLASNTCKDWNEFVKAKAENAKNEGRHGDAKLWESRVVDQSIINAQIASANNALITALKDHPDDFCVKEQLTNGECTYAAFLRSTKAKADGVCADKTPECQRLQAEEYTKILYKTGATEGNGSTTTDTVGGLVKQAVDQYNADKLAEAYDALEKSVNALPDSDSQKMKIRDLAEAACMAAGKTDVQCALLSTAELLNTYQSALEKTFFKPVTVESYTGTQMYLLDKSIYDPATSDECKTNTSGGACPAGTATCICQTTPTYRATCAAIGQNCKAVCLATHNICVDKCNDKPITTSDVTPNPEHPVCQGACSTTNPCSDGTSCVNGKCVNPSCPTETDCMCGTSTTPICGDGLINDSPQAPEQCELGNPAGTSCNWDTCNHNTCRCPDTNPNWDIVKSASVVCVNNNTANVYAQVKYNISATYINTTSPTTAGTLERVIDRPENYMATWFDNASVTNGGVRTNVGGLVDAITWDLSGALSTFTIPTGQTQVTKTNLLSYTFNVPKDYFGRYVNLVTGYPNQTTDDNSFSYTNSVFIACNIPTTAFVDIGVVKALMGIFLVAAGLVFASSQKGSAFIAGIVESPMFEGITMIFASKAKKEHLKKISFEDKVLKRAKKK